MSWTKPFRHTNGTDTLYALPLTTGAWSATGAVSGDDSAQNTLYVFAGLVDGTDYEVFVQGGGSPAEGDTPLAEISAPGNVPSAAENAEATRTELATELARIDESVSAAKELTSDYDAAKTAATQASVNAIDGIVDSILEDTGTTLPATLTIISGYIDTEVAAIKTVTDQFVFTVSGQVDANALTGGGSGGGLDEAGVRSAIGLASANLDTQLSAIDTAVGDIPGASENATAVWGAATRTITSGSTLGSGSEQKTLTVTVSSQPADNVAVWITTDSNGANVVAGTVYTDAFGKTPTLLLDPGTYYAWKQKAGVNFTNPETFNVPVPA